MIGINVQSIIFGVAKMNSNTPAALILSSVPKGMEARGCEKCENDINVGSIIFGILVSRLSLVKISCINRFTSLCKKLFNLSF